MNRQEVKWDFSSYDYGTSKRCPTCEAIDNGNGGWYVVGMPETVNLLCEKHYKEFREWHDKEVRLGNIKLWFKGGEKNES